MTTLQQEITAQAAKFDKEVGILRRQIEELGDGGGSRAELAVSQAKRVRRECSLVIQYLAQLRDENPTAQEAQGNGRNTNS